MNKFIYFFLLLICQISFAETCETKREIFIENAVTKVWKTTICPQQRLSFHTHQFARVVIPDEDGRLTVIYKSGKEVSLHLKKQVPLYLDVAQGQELHQDENPETEPLHVTVIELKNG
ncbi:hypothetical protein [Legionella massiliensis]|nr:hypothetical protein [Legionella massiliensis]